MGLLACVIASLLVHTVTAVSLLNDIPPAPPANGEVKEDPFLSANKGIYNVDNGAELIDGDVAMDKEGVERLYGENKNTKRGAQLKSLGRLWLGSPPTLPYEISDDLQGTTAEVAIKAAMAEIEQLSCVRFRERISSDSDYVTFVMASGCWSYVGRIGGVQSISLGSSACWNKRTAVHEIMHALGFLHEQSRPDRDDHVLVFWSNIPSAAQSNFRKYDSNTIDSMGQSYDYNSVMHYNNKAFAINGNQDTLQKIGDATFKLGQSSDDGGMTKSDTKQLNLLYDCGSNPGTNTTTTAPGATTETTTVSPGVTTNSTTTSPGVTTTSTTTSPGGTTSPATTLPTGTTSPTNATTIKPTKSPYCGLRCFIRRILRRIRGRFRRRRRRRRFFGRRRRRYGGRWGKKRDTQKDDEAEPANRKPIVKVDNILAQLDEEDDIKPNKVNDQASIDKNVAGNENVDDVIDDVIDEDVDDDDDVNDDDDVDSTQDATKQDDNESQKISPDDNKLLEEIQKALQERS